MRRRGRMEDYSGFAPTLWNAQRVGQRVFLMNSMRGGLLFRGFAFHAGHPVGAVLRKLELHGVRSWGKHFHGEAALHGLSAHVFVASPGPGVAVHSSSRVLGLAHAVERVVGVHLLIRI